MTAHEVKRIALICYHTSPLAQAGQRDAGGMNVYVRESAAELAALGWQVDIFTRATSRGAGIEPIAPGARVIPIPGGPRRSVEKTALFKHVDEFARGVAAFRLRHRLRYAVVHSHYWLSACAGQKLADLWAVPHAVMFHTLGEVKNRARLGELEPAQRLLAERGIVQAADRIICATTHEVGLLQSIYGADRRRLTVIPCGVDVERFRPNAEGEALRRSFGAKRLLLYAGRLEPLKGIDIVIRALAQLEEPRPLLLVAGGDRHSRPEVARLERIAAEEGVGESVLFLGAVAHEDLAAYYAAADACVVPSYYESFGMAALEAQACGTPVVAFRVGGLPGVLRDGETGYLVPWRCPEPFAEKLDLLLRNDALRRNLGDAAREWALRFRWSEVSRQLSSLYETLSSRDSGESDCHPRLRPAAGSHVRCEVA